MARAPIGQRIRKRRQELGRSQTGLAAEVGISASYLNLIEHNKRTIGGALLNRIATAIALDSRDLAGTEEARLIAELAEVAADSGEIGGGLSAAHARDIVASSPQAARSIVALFRAYHEARMRSDLIGERLGEDAFLAEASHQILSLITTIRSYAEILKDYGDLSDAERARFVGTLVEESEALAARATDMFDFMGGRGARRPRPSPREEIEDFVSDRANHFPRLERAAEATLKAFADAPPTTEAMIRYLRRRHGVGVERAATAQPSRAAEGGRFALAEASPAASSRFDLARLIGTLEHGGLIGTLTEEAGLTAVDGPPRLQRALASYFAAALLMPYGSFQEAAFELRMDVDRLGQRFGASFEQVCHRLCTLRRPGAEGVPLHFLRTDIAGNISKRFSASGLRLPRYGGACPRWIVHHAFAWPGRIVPQVMRLPDGEAFFSIARTTGSPGTGGFAGPTHAVMIGAALGHARRFVHADGIDLAAASVAVPAGIGCRQCPRDDCNQRAFERTPLAPIAAGGRPPR